MASSNSIPAFALTSGQAMKSFSLFLLVILVSLLSQTPARLQTPPAPVHHLDPLSVAEITAVTEALTKAGRLSGATRVVTIELSEPDKSTRPPARVGRAVLYDWSSGVSSEMTVDLQSRTVSAPTTIATGDPPLRRMVIDRATEIALGDRRVVQALTRRGVNPERVTFLGGVGEGTRLPRRGSAISIFAQPFLWDGIGLDTELEGFGVRVELVSGVVEQILEGPSRLSARTDEPRAGTPAARPLRPLVVSQPNGPSFSIRGSEILWDRWRLHFGVHPRRGLEIYDVSIVDGSRTRSVLYRAALSELMTPYGDPEYTSWYPRDAGDYGMTIYSAARASAIVGTDAPANATFAPAIFSDHRGQPVTVPRAVAIYERDGGVLWRHSARSSRARQLVLSSYTSVDNYDYLFHWVFNQDGAIDVQVQLSGVMNVKPVAASRDEGHGDEEPMFTHLVAPRVSAPNHQHFFNFRIDFDVDGGNNRVLEMNTSNQQERLRDRLGEWFGMQQTTLKSELTAQRDLNLPTARRWIVANAGRTNDLGQHTGYALVPGENAPAFQAPNSAPRRRAAFLEHHLWVTLFERNQMYASGEWVNLLRDREGVSMWSAGDRPIVDRDVVLWYTFSVLHLPRPEDWPVMPAHTAGFRLVPIAFFGSNPTAPAQ
jgi:primary-amine oxidase